MSYFPLLGCLVFTVLWGAHLKDHTSLNLYNVFSSLEAVLYFTLYATPIFGVFRHQMHLNPPAFKCSSSSLGGWAGKHWLQFGSMFTHGQTHMAVASFLQGHWGTRPEHTAAICRTGPTGTRVIFHQLIGDSNGMLLKMCSSCLMSLEGEVWECDLIRRYSHRCCLLKL